MTAKVLARIRRVAAAIPGPVLTGRMMTQGIAMNSQSSRSIPELFGDAVGQLAKLVGNEFDLARAELSEKANQAGRAAAMIGAGCNSSNPGARTAVVRSIGRVDTQRAFGSSRIFIDRRGRGPGFVGTHSDRLESGFRR